ncbi:hypothetical protein [Cohnella fermenti]|uniref:Uncharacterized protein n=1 Tax=Cohnella fermenti TaxID=2565925 RepID=A0A4S4BXN6_9BACL|nr:hypothetical protein [Cohnella fermenti]THF79971.1 hypothetical protein E6C55_11655 [Cohnella fermenti]
MDKVLRRYYQLKQKSKEIEQELAELRESIVAYCAEHELSEVAAGGYRAKLVRQERKEFDGAKLYEALPDPEVWRLLSKPDPSKIGGLVKLNVITEDSIKDTFTVQPVTLVQVEKK